MSIPLYFWLQYTGVKNTTAAVAAILVVGLVPAGTAIVSHCLGSERFNRAKALGLLLGFAGVLLIVGEKDVRIAAESGYLLGAAALVADAPSFAFYSPLSKRFMRHHSPLATTAGMCTGALGLLAILGSVVAISRAERGTGNKEYGIGNTE